jgi:hypothetical protein
MYVLCEKETEILNIMQMYLNLIEENVYQTKVREIHIFHTVVESTVLHRSEILQEHITPTLRFEMQTKKPEETDGKLEAIYSSETSGSFQTIECFSIEDQPLHILSPLSKIKGSEKNLMRLKKESDERIKALRILRHSRLPSVSSKQGLKCCCCY